MPHLTIDYSANLEQVIDVAALCDCVRCAAIDTGVFPMPGVRVRAFAATHVSIADGNAAHGYVDINVRLRAGRTTAAKSRAIEAIFEAARRFLEPAMQDNPIALSTEIRDIHPSLSPKCGTIRDHLQE